MSTVLSIEGASFRFGATTALQGVDLQISSGECVALLGPNGAGKTTLIGLATGLLAPQGEGRIRVAGGDPRTAATRRRMGVVQQSVGFPRTLKVRELVRGAAIRAGLPAAAAVRALEDVGLTDLASRRSGKLSGGQQQRLQLAMGLVADPSLLLLDEPTVGLDVSARRSFWQTLRSRRRQGTGILLTTHVIEEAAAVADRVVLLHRGRIIAAGSPTELTARLPDRSISARTALTVQQVGKLPGVLSAVERDGRVILTTPEPERVVGRLLAEDPDLRELLVEAATLEQVLVDLTERNDQNSEVAA